MTTLTHTRTGFTLSSALVAALTDRKRSHRAPSMGGAQRETELLTLYTSEPQHKIDALTAAFTEDNPDIKIDVLRAPTRELTARIEAEQLAGTIGADVLLAADSATFESYKNRDLLLEYLPRDVFSLHANVIDPDGFYVGTRIIPTVICYNTEFDVVAPRSWKQLAENRFYGRLALPNPQVSGAAAHNLAVWRETLTLGPRWIETIASHRPNVAHSNSWVGELVAAGVQHVGIVTDHVARELAAKGLPIAIQYPTDGAPYVTQPVAIFRHTAHPDAAKRFLDFLVSKQGQELAVTQHYLPVRRDVQPPNGFPRRSGVRLLAPAPIETTATRTGTLDNFTALTH
ncbi:extracellular solute-binding protein [Antrihabitans sp. YC2-6]|uniref:extracellular solute-binding protein n=1 Tax=Antrihabitans sp. YC2-6 TaxID=2799498 RepID=UPI001F370969|nr:extracellular solute-binding protein [Antrihabitans sp. YC2-6]